MPVVVESLLIKQAARHARHALLEKQVTVVTRAHLGSIVRVPMNRPEFVVTAQQDIIKETLNKHRASHAFLASTTIKQRSLAASYAQQTPSLMQRTGVRSATLALRVERLQQGA